MGKWLKIVLWTAGGLAVAVVIACGALYYVYDTRFYPEPPAAAYPPPGSAVDAQRQDLDYYRRLIALDRSFSAAARAESNARLDTLAGAPEALDADHFRIALLEIAALADNGHTGLYSDASRAGLPRLLPIRLSEFADGFHVMQTRPRDADLLGTRVTTIDGVPIDTVVSRLETLRGGNDTFRHRYAGRMLNVAGYLHGLDIAPSAETSKWIFQRPDGARAERTLTSYQPAPDDPWPGLWRARSPEPVEGDGEWVAYRTEGPLPVTYQAPDRAFRALTIPDTCVALVQLKSNTDAGDERIGEFLVRTEAELRAQPPCAVILDLRRNGGGDYTRTAAFAALLPDLAGPQGVYVLTGPDTFSAGITTAVFTKQADPLRVTLLGEPVGDRMTFWSEGGSACLPNAPLCFHYSTARHDYGHDCTDWRTCFWLNWIYPAHIDSLAPAEIIETTFTVFAQGRDPVLERALALIADTSAD